MALSMSGFVHADEASCRKIAQKAAKAKAKEMKKQNWEYGGSTTLEMAFEEYNYKTGECGLYEPMEVTVENIKYTDQGASSCMNKANRQIVMECFSDVRGVSTNIDRIEEDDASRKEVDKLGQKYSGLLSGVVQRAITLTKKESNGRYTVRCLFLVNKTKKRSLINAMSKDGERLDEEADKVLKELFEEK